jgi:hypothetical protein
MPSLPRLIATCGQRDAVHNAKLGRLSGEHRNDKVFTNHQPPLHSIRDYRRPRFQNNDRDIEPRILGSCEDLHYPENPIIASTARGLDVPEQRVRKR